MGSARRDNLDPDPQGHEDQDLGEEMDDGQQGKGADSGTLAPAVKEGAEDRDEAFLSTCEPNRSRLRGPQPGRDPVGVEQGSSRFFGSPGYQFQPQSGGEG